MQDNADVRSLEQLEVFLECTQRFRTNLLKEIEELQIELRKLTNWIENDAVNYWQQQLVFAQRQFSEAQDALTRCMSCVREDERKPCSEEKKRFQLAKERRSLCEEKLKTVHAAASAWERDLRKNQGKIQRCRDLADSDLPVAIHLLSEQIERLAAYAGLRSAAVSSKKPAATNSAKSTGEPRES